MLRPVELIAPIDRRQSETALMVARGVRRLLRAQGFSTICEMPLPGGRRADIVAVGNDGAIHIVEIKSSVADFRSDQKWQDYMAHCDRLYFAAPTTVPESLFPAEAGLIMADAYGASVLRDPELHKLAGATRRSLLLAFARLAADRLHLIGDPECGDEFA